MRLNKKINAILWVAVLTATVAGTASAHCCGAGVIDPPEAKADEVNVAPKVQTKFPVMDGNDINKNLFVDIKGKRVYVCCKGCIAQVEKSPDKYLAKIKATGEVASTVLCGKCGVAKGTKGCCKKDAVRCKKCKAIKGSAGCCKLPSKGEDAVLCVKCDEIKGSTDCCKSKS